MPFKPSRFFRSSILPFKGSLESEAVGPSYYRKNCLYDDACLENKRIGLTVLFCGHCIGCSSYFEASKTFHNYDEAFSFRPLYCNHCSPSFEPLNLFIGHRKISYELICHECGQIYCPKEIVLGLGCDLGLCNFCQGIKGLKNYDNFLLTPNRFSDNPLNAAAYCASCYRFFPLAQLRLKKDDLVCHGCF